MPPAGVNRVNYNNCFRRDLVLNQGAKCDFCSLYCQYVDLQRLVVTFNEGEKAEAGWVLLALCPGQL